MSHDPNSTPTPNEQQQPTNPNQISPSTNCSANASSPAPPVKTRRVGTVTMALFLIVIGVVMLARLVFPSLNIAFIAKLSPVVLIFLGIEILVANFRQKETGPRYDIASILICLLLIGGTLVAGVVPVFLQAESQTHQLQEQQLQSLNQKGQEIQANNSNILEIDWNSWVSYDPWILYTSSAVNTSFVSESYTLDHPGIYSSTGLHITFAKHYTSQNEFIRDCKELAGQLQSAGLTNLDWIQIKTRYYDLYPSSDEGTQYFIHLTFPSPAGYNYQNNISKQVFYKGQYYNEYEYESLLESEKWERENQEDAEEFDSDAEHGEDTASSSMAAAAA